MHSTSVVTHVIENSSPPLFPKLMRSFVFIVIAHLLLTIGSAEPSWALKTKPSNHNIRRHRGLRKARRVVDHFLKNKLRVRLPRDGSIHQIMAHNYDWDDNILKMPTLTYLTRNSDGKEVPFDTVGFAKVRSELGKDKTWYADYDDHRNGAIRDFRDYSLPNRFYLDTGKALKSSAWAESARSFQKHLNSPITARWTFVTTTRGHARQRLYDGISLLFVEGFARFLMPKENLVGITYPEIVNVNGKPMPQLTLSG